VRVTLSTRQSRGAWKRSSRSFYLDGLTRVSAPLPTLSHPRRTQPRLSLESIFKARDCLRHTDRCRVYQRKIILKASGFGKERERERDDLSPRGSSKKIDGFRVLEGNLVAVYESRLTNFYARFLTGTRGRKRASAQMECSDGEGVRDSPFAARDINISVINITRGITDKANISRVSISEFRICSRNSTFRKS